MSAEIIYNVHIDKLDETIEKIFTQIPEEGQQAIFDEVVRKVEFSLKMAAPTRTYPSVPPRIGGGLRNSIRTVRTGKFEALTGPTKKVGGYDLGLLLERGSKGGKIITPKSKSWLKFFWAKTGQTHYAKKVTRGTIAPRRWVRKTVTKIVPEIKMIVMDIWESAYRKHAT